MNTHLKQLWAAMKLPKNFKKSYKFFCLGLDIRVTKAVCHVQPWEKFIRAEVTDEQGRKAWSKVIRL